MATRQTKPVYVDLSLAFTANPITGDVSTLVNQDAIKRSVINLVLTNHYERLFHPEVGGNVQAMLFELFTPVTQQFVQREIANVIANFEPRATNVSVVVNANPDNNELDATITFTATNISTPITVNVLLERVR